jgi:hypothetical protein
MHLSGAIHPRLVAALLLAASLGSAATATVLSVTAGGARSSAGHPSVWRPQQPTRAEATPGARSGDAVQLAA